MIPQSLLLDPGQLALWTTPYPILPGPGAFSLPLSLYGPWLWPQWSLTLEFVSFLSLLSPYSLSGLEGVVQWLNK